MAGRNPAWTVEEIILATEIYISNERRVVGPNHADVIALSELLNRLPFHRLDDRNDKFRNPVGVSRKLGNIRSVDPTWNGADSHVGRNDDYFWRVLQGDEVALKREAAGIRREYALTGHEDKQR